MTPAAPPRPFRLCLVGAGRAGTAVAAALRRAGNDVTAVASRSASSADAAAARLGAPVAGLDDLPECDVVLLGVPESAVREVAEVVAPRLRRHAVVWHLTGSLGVAALEAVRRAGGLRCALHPVQAFPDPDAGLARLPGSAWGLTCDDVLRAWAREVVEEDLAGRAFDVREEDRPVWHAAAVTIASGAVALLSLGERLLAAIGVHHAGGVLGPLAAGAVANASESGATASLTGPAVRGEWATVTSHLRALEAAAPELVEPYREATRLIFRAAERAGKVTDEARQAAVSILGEGA
ncbi:MAG: prephenate dehydrogenase/arogenate dehydrogenase family protein [Actinomycetota bacterium]|nr:prephenate dehydrogenase/arogenate dehydrogenase family protein [Actinomycetota bacterium]